MRNGEGGECEGQDKKQNKRRRLKGGQHIEVNEEFEHRNVEESGSGGRENNAWIHRSSGKKSATLM